MKKLSILFAALAVTCFSFMSVPADDATTTTTKMTLNELREIYGDNIQLADGSSVADLDGQMTIDFMTSSQPPCVGEPPCEGALTAATARARVRANECCCTVVQGVECCSDGGLIAILFLVEPNSPQCN